MKYIKVLQVPYTSQRNNAEWHDCRDDRRVNALPSNRYWSQVQIIDINKIFYMPKGKEVSTMKRWQAKLIIILLILASIATIFIAGYRTAELKYTNPTISIND